jgi:hypothetical protein
MSLFHQDRQESLGLTLLCTGGRALTWDSGTEQHARIRAIDQASYSHQPGSFVAGRSIVDTTSSPRSELGLGTRRRGPLPAGNTDERKPKRFWFQSACGPTLVDCQPTKDL